MTTKPSVTSFSHTFKTDSNLESKSSDIIVIKIGSSSITGPDGTILVSNLGKFVQFAYDLRSKGYKPVIVSSGAVSVGVSKLKLTERPTSMIMKQAVAAVGQSALMSLYDTLFGAVGILCAQVLLTRDNINNDYHYLNATNTLEQLLQMNIVPIINENDTVSVSELRIGDNDSLSALVSCMLNAKHLFLATDVSSLYTADPRIDPNAQPLHFIENIHETVEKFSTPSVTTTTTSPTTSSSSSSTTVTATSGKWGTGGIATKITAASLCAACGVDSSIISSTELENIFTILNGSYTVGTTFKGFKPALNGRKKFLWVGIIPNGEIYIDMKCATLFTNDLTRSYHLLPAGINYCSNEIQIGTCVNIIVADDIYLKEKFGKAYIPATSQQQSQQIQQTNEKEHNNNNDNNTTNTNITPTLLKPGTIIGRGIVNFNSDDIMKIRGINSKQINTILDYTPRNTHVIDSENLAIHFRHPQSQQQQQLQSQTQ